MEEERKAEDGGKKEERREKEQVLGMTDGQTDGVGGGVACCSFS